MKSFFVNGLAIAAATILLSSARAADPTVESVLEKYVTAIGGKAALEKVESRVWKADFKVNDASSLWERWEKAPNKQASKVDITGFGMFQDGFDGTVAWAKDGNGVREKTGIEAARVKMETDFNKELKLNTLYPNLKVKGTGKLNDEDVVTLESQSAGTGMDRFSFSAKTGYLVRQQGEYDNDGTLIEVDSRISNYKDVDGVKYPHNRKIKLSMGGNELIEFEIVVKEVKHNEKLDDAKFSKPKE